MGILDIVLIFLIVAWIGGFSFNIAGGLIHLLLIVALITLIVRLIMGAGWLSTSR